MQIYFEVVKRTVKGNYPWKIVCSQPLEFGGFVLMKNVKKFWSSQWLIGKDPDAGKDWRQEKKGTTQNKTAGWHHQLNGHESEQTLGDRGQGSLVCCSPWGSKGQTQLSDRTTNVGKEAKIGQVNSSWALKGLGKWEIYLKWNQWTVMGFSPTELRRDYKQIGDGWTDLILEASDKVATEKKFKWKRECWKKEAEMTMWVTEGSKQRGNRQGS